MIKDINALLSKQRNKIYVCPNSNISSIASKNDNHLKICLNNTQNTVNTEPVVENEKTFLYRLSINKSFKSEENLRNHMLSCFLNNPFKVQMPNKYNNILKFEKCYMQSEIPFRIYSNFGTVNIKENDRKFKQKPSCYSIVIVSYFQDILQIKLSKDVESLVKKLYIYLSTILKIFSQLFIINYV